MSKEEKGPVHSRTIKKSCLFFQKLAIFKDVIKMNNSGEEMKFKSSKGFNSSGYTKSIKTYNIPLKSPMRLLPRMQKRIIFSTFVGFLGAYLKKQCFWKMGNFETNEDFWVKLSAKLPH